MGDGNKPLI